MAVSEKDVDKIAKLVMLRFSDVEKKQIQEDMNIVLEYISKLNELNLDDVEPFEHINDAVNIFREDKVKPSLTQEEALKNAPSKYNNFFTVPKFIDKKDTK